MNDRAKTWLTIHSYISMFFLPLAIVYAITGAVSLTSSHHGPVGYGQPHSMLRDRAGRQQEAFSPMQQLSNENSSVNGDMERRAPQREDHVGLMGRLLMLHKGEGNVAIKIYGLLFALALILIYFSGIWICWSNPSRRRQMLICGFAGLVVTVIVLAI